MGLAPLTSPLHTSTRARRPANTTPTSPASIPGGSQQPRRVMSPNPEEIMSPRAVENLNASSFNPQQSTFTTSPDFGESLVEDVLDDASQEEEEDETIILGHEILAALGRPPYEERSGLGWRGWLGVAAFGVISGGVILIAGSAKKETHYDKRMPSYYLSDRNYR